MLYNGDKMHRKGKPRQNVKSLNEKRQTLRSSLTLSTKAHLCIPAVILLLVTIAYIVFILSSISQDEMVTMSENHLGDGKSVIHHITKIPTHRCNRGSEGSCKCAKSDPFNPSIRSRDDWKRAFEMNLMLANSTSNVKSLDVVLLGDSITEDWNGRRLGKPNRFSLPIKNVFDSLFRKESGGKVDGIALGISGDRNNNLLWRIQNGEVPEFLNSKVYWLLIGTNDLSDPKCSAEVVFMGIVKCVELLISMKPHSIIVLNSILPRTNKKDRLLLGSHPTNHMIQVNPTDDRSFDYWSVINAINQQLEIFATKYDNVKFFNATDYFLEISNGVFFINKELMPDRLHPSALGHKVWGDRIVDYLINEIGV